MNNLNPAQIARILNMYAGQPYCQYNSILKRENRFSFLNAAFLQFDGSILINAKREMNAYSFDHAANDRLKLKPLETITEADMQQIGFLATGIRPLEWEMKIPESTYWRYVSRPNSSLEVRLFFKQCHVIVCNVYSNSVSHSDNPCMNLIVQFLIEQGYAVPLFIGIDHPDNGKTAIELGLAKSIYEEEKLSDFQ